MSEESSSRRTVSPEVDTETQRAEAGKSFERPPDGDAQSSISRSAGEGVQAGARHMPLRVLLAWLNALKIWLEFLSQIGALLGARKSRERPWRVKIGRRTQAVPLTDDEIRKLLQRQKDLKDLDRLADAAAKFRLPESDFFADPLQIERLIRRILEENPPWLTISRSLAGSDGGGSAQDTAFLFREQETQETQYVTLFFPDDNWRDLPLASLTLRPVRHLNEVWQARLLDQILPPEVLLDRVNRGEILIPVRNNVKHRLEFRHEERWMQVPVRKRVPIAIEQEGSAAEGAQLLYVLLDSSASMRGRSATLALATISAAVRANLGQRNARYLFRRYADQEQIWPSVVEPPIQARTLEQKDALLDLICATNFNGGATHVNHALDVAISDVVSLRREEQLEASILLVTDGRAEMLESTGRRIRETGVRLHTVMVAPEPNPSLAAISESFTILDIGPDSAASQREESGSAVVRQPRRRPSYQI